jgi:hypothetical protein
MLKSFKKITVLICSFVLIGCGGGMKISQFKGDTPKFQPEVYFNDDMTAHGLFQDRFGNVRRQFTADIDGNWDPETKTLTLNEEFIYADGMEETRIWTIEKTGENSYIGDADNVIGKAEGTTAGNALNFNYDFDLEMPDGGSIKVHFDDWMFLQPDGKTMINRATVSKFGITLGTVTVVFVK